MHEELKEEDIVNKVGGRFKLSTLIQKRLVQLQRGSRPLLDIKSDDKMHIVLQEILHDRISLDTSNEVRLHTGSASSIDSAPELDLDDL
jgi:DNA-directed RNA polymerase subunit omega